ncbi:MAG: beta strand repeat-containing protein [Planctomycetia bacterium]
MTGATGTNGTFNTSAGSWTTPGGSFSYSTPSSGTGAPGTQAAINPMFTFAQPTGNLSSLSWINGSYLYLRWSETDEGGSDATFGIDNFNLWTAAATASLTWNITTGTWDTSATNWLNGSSAAVYTPGDNVTFSGSDGGTIALSGALAPASITISAPAGTYTFSGATASDKITGVTNIAKSGGGTAVFTSANDFSGGVNITGGIVSISGSDQLGNGTVTLSGGQLTNTAGSALAVANALTVGGGNGTVDTGGQNLTVNGGSTIGGVLTKIGNGTLLLASPAVNVGAGFNVSAGTLQLGGTATTGVYSLAISSTLTGNLALGGSQRLNVNAGGSITGSGTLQFMTSGALLTQQSGFTGGLVSAPIALNSTDAAFTPGVYMSGSYTPASFVSTIGATGGASGTAGTFTVNSVISGNADVNISNNSSTGGGRGLLILGGQSTYSGNTIIDTNAPDGFSAVNANVQLGVSNALPTTTGLIFGTRSGAATAGAAVMDLNGYDQQVAFVGNGAQASATKFLTITNLGSGTSIFTISGSTNATFGGAFANSVTGHLNLVKQGSGTQTLTGSSSYTGGLTISAGAISVASDAALGAPSGGITLGGGTLEMTSGFTLASGRTITAAASTASTLAVTTGTVSYGGPFTGSGNLDKAGAGRFVVSNASSGYSGIFTVSAGTLEVTGSGAFANATLSQTGGTLLLAPAGGGDVFIPDLGGSGGTTEIAAGATARVGGPGNSSYNGRVRGQGGLQKDGAGDLTLNGDNDFAGNTRIAAGKLKLGSAGGLSATPLIEIDTNAIFDVTAKSGGFAIGNGQKLGGRGTILGDLEFGSGSLLVFDATGPLLVGSGSASFSPGFGVASIFGLSSSTPDGTYTLLNETTGGGINFTNLVNVGQSNAYNLGSGKTAYFQQGSLQLVIVPEPSALALAGLGIGLACYTARKRRQSR